MKRDLISQLNVLLNKINDIALKLDIDLKRKRILKLESLVNAPSFWDDMDNALDVNKELSFLKKMVNDVDLIIKSIKDDLDVLSVLSDDECADFDISKLSEQIAELEVSTFLCGEFDEANCYLEIHPGAGGVEACDWAMMLCRMYERFCDGNGFEYEVIDLQKGDEAGYKSVMLLVKGLYAYGYLKNETGVHRLVRISPFDANKRRHTSFASVSVTPQIKNDISLDIKDSDLKIDVYHSSGAGGQSVNTSNSAVRITYLPSNIVVTCQNERSQLKNKEEALKILKSKLYQNMVLEKENELMALKGDVSAVNFGSQIRNYVLEPYKQVKDLRSGYVTSNASKVLDGDLKEIIESVLRGG